MTLFKIVLIVSSGVLYFSCSTFQKLQHREKPQQTMLKDLPHMSEDTTIALQDTTSKIDFSGVPLSPAAELLLRACDNFVDVLSRNDRSAEVFLIKGALYYNLGRYQEARQVYQTLLDSFPNAPQKEEAINYIAQSYQQQGKNDDAMLWYDKLSHLTSDTSHSGKEVAEKKAQILFRVAEDLQKRKEFFSAAQAFEKVSKDYPHSKIADVALYNAGLLYGKTKYSKEAILQFVSLGDKYGQSNLAPKAIFHAAQTYESIKSWEKASELYLSMGERFPRHPLIKDAFLNAGLCFDKIRQTIRGDLIYDDLDSSYSILYRNASYKMAAIFENFSEIYKDSEEAPNILFQAGETYGELKDWKNVSRVNQIFSKRYGQDQNRLIQAECMVGIAFFMQKEYAQALKQLGKTINTFIKIQKPTLANQFYAAKAQFTMGRIYHLQGNEIKLVLPKATLIIALEKKKTLLKLALENYKKVIPFNIKEWTTRTTYFMGLSLEEFGIVLFNQERPKTNNFSDVIALELTIAEAVKEAFVTNALPYYELNVKVALQDSIEDEWTQNSRKKLCRLPFLAGKNYSDIIHLVKNREMPQAMSNTEMIKNKLDLLQTITPYQNEALNLYLKTLEIGSRYALTDPSLISAKSMISATTYMIGEIFFELVELAKSAGAPKNYDEYEKFVFNTNLLTQVEEYENEALKAFYKNIEIGKSYKIQNEWIKHSKEMVASILYNKARDYETLGRQALDAPPFPKKVTENEIVEYQYQFEELGFKLQDVAKGIYEEILIRKKEDKAEGDEVTSAYLKLFQNEPAKYGTKRAKEYTSTFNSDTTLRGQSNTLQNWMKINFDDSLWLLAGASHFSGPISLSYFTGAKVVSLPPSASDQNLDTVFYRNVFNVLGQPAQGTLEILSFGDLVIYLNETQVFPVPSILHHRGELLKLEISSNLVKGQNLLAFKVLSREKNLPSVIFRLQVRESKEDFVAIVPGDTIPIAPEIIARIKTEMKEVVEKQSPPTRKVLFTENVPLQSASQPLKQRVRVEKPEVLIHSGPGKSFKELGRVKSGIVLDILTSKEDWFEVSASDSLRGWVAREDLLVPVPPRTQRVSDKLLNKILFVKNNKATLFMGPSKKQKIVSQVVKNDILIPLQQERDWYFVKTYDKQFVWVHGGDVALYDLGYFQKQNKYVIVKNKEGILRTGPHKKYAQETILRQGKRLLYITKNGSWYFIILSNGKSGWIFKDEVAFAKT